MKKSTAITNKFYKPLTVSMGQAVARANRYRDSLNPMRGLNMRRAVELLESYGRGEFADLMWTYAAPNLGIESADADLLALIERRVGALVELDWNIKTVDEDYPNFSATLAEDQAAALAELYYGVDNLSEAIEHLALASFRGFAHLEKVFGADGRLEVLAVIDQWNVVRDGTRGPWKYNPDALQTDFAHLPNEYLLTPERVLCREVRRPINRVGLTKVVRQNLSQKDWDAFVEIYGIPSGIIIAPPDLAQDKVGEFYEAAKNASGGSHVALPNGSDYKPNDQPRGVNPFRDHLRYLQEQLILAGTGGLLTMLTESGSGTLAGGAHADTFEIIARAEARKISEVFQRGIDREVIDRLFPGKPLLAYFELSANESVDPGEILKHAQTAAAAGLAIDADEL
ncbi:MAG: DUF935 domain-containing protein, partial [Verrucomicrobiales bacterium]|nr:DUF935 domain-containing protein [Verrucomicrobiales bacterium]